MGTHRQRPPLVIRPHFSRRLTAFVSFTHLAAGGTVLALPGPWRSLLLFALASLAYQVYVQVLRRAPWSIRGLIWHADGTWTVRLVSGEETEARLSASTFLSVPLVVLNLRRGRLKRWSLPLFADALDPDQLRRLRQRLRIEGVGTSEEPAPV